LLKSVKTATNANDAFEDIDIAIFLGGFPRKKGMTRRDLLKINAGIFKAQATALNKHAKKTCHSLVIANPANTLCFVLASNCPNISPNNFSALTRLDQNRAKY
jgi:malate/lactate dehydrogenase